MVPLDVSDLVLLSRMCLSEGSADGEGLLMLVFCGVGEMLHRMRTINRGLYRAALSGSACWSTVVGELRVMVIGAGWEGEWIGVSVV